MSRMTCLLLGLALMFAFLPVAMSRQNDVSPAELTIARGGNPADGKGSADCEDITGVYVGCKRRQDTCVGCVTGQVVNGEPVLSTADTLDPTAPKGATGFMEGQNSQDCGDIYMGTCVDDRQSPTGFSCVGKDMNTVCSQGVLEIVPQPAPAAQP